MGCFLGRQGRKTAGGDYLGTGGPLGTAQTRPSKTAQRYHFTANCLGEFRCGGGCTGTGMAPNSNVVRVFYKKLNLGFSCNKNRTRGFKNDFGRAKKGENRMQGTPTSPRYNTCRPNAFTYVKKTTVGGGGGEPHQPKKKGLRKLKTEGYR